MAFSDRRTRALALVETSTGTGPWRDATLAGEPVRLSTDPAGKRWPELMHAARQVGLLSVSAVPLRWRDKSVGALALFAEQKALLDDRDLRMAQAFAVMRRYARAHNHKLAEVAKAVVDGDQSVAELTRVES